MGDGNKCGCGEHFPELVEQFFVGDRIHQTHGFVQHDDLCPGRKCTHHADFLHLATAQVLHVEVIIQRPFGTDRWIALSFTNYKKLTEKEEEEPAEGEEASEGQETAGEENEAVVEAE